MRKNFYNCLILFLVFLAGIINRSFAEEAKQIIYTGKVINYNARPVEGATVACYRYLDKAPLGCVQTTSDGRFLLQVETDETRPTLVAYKEGLALGWKEFFFASEPIIRLGKPSMFKGIVADETGRPVPDARVRICLKNEMMAHDDIAPLVPEDWFTTKTNAMGEFIFNNIPKGAAADFGVEAPGKASIWTICDFGPREGEQFAVGNTDIRIILPPAGFIKGQVIDEHNDQAVAGVSVKAIPYNSRLGWSFPNDPVQTDPNGRFILTGLAPDKYLLKADSDNAGSGHILVTLEAGQTIPDVKIPLVKGVPFKVMVYESEKGEPLEGADVTVSQNEAGSRHTIFSQRAKTDANGLARLTVPPGECELKVFKIGYGGTFQSHRVQIEPGQTIRHEVSLPRSACIVSGQVLDGQGQALSNALVMYQPWEHVRAMTDANGQFMIDNFYVSRLPSRARMLARHIAFGLAGVGILNDPNKSGRLQGKIILKPGHKLTGSVTDPAGKGIPAAYVKLLILSSTSTITEVATDPNGVYRIPSIPPPGDNLQYGIVAQAEGFGQAVAKQIQFHDDITKPVQINPIILQPADEVISGVVMDSNDQPVSGVRVSVYGQRIIRNYREFNYGRTLTDSQGRFRISGVPKETLWIQTYAPNQKSGQTWALGGSVNVKVVLGQKLFFSPSLIGKPLLDLKDMKIDPTPTDTNNKKILICFFDMNQRPSRHCITQLAKRAQELKAKDVVVVAVQTSKVEKNALNDWVKKYNILFPAGMVEGNEEQIRFTWGVRSLPWLILTDTKHLIRSEGFNLSELDEIVRQINRE